MTAKKSIDTQDTQPKQDTSINCLEIAASLEIDAKKVHEIIQKTGKPVILTVKNLKVKYPELNSLPDTLPLFRLRKNATIDNVFECDTIKIFKDDDGNVYAFDCELNAIINAKIKNFKTGIAGYAVVTINDLELTVGLSCSDDHRVMSLEIAESFDHNNPVEDEHGNQFDINGFTGLGTPPSDYLALVPRPEIPLYSPDLLENAIYEIIGHGKKSRQFDTPLLDIKDEQGKIFKNVICNSALSRIFEKHGIGAKFSIVQRYIPQDKEGKAIKSSGNGKEVWKVKIKDLQAVDLSDIDIDI